MCQQDEQDKQEGAWKTKEAAEKAFPNEKWVDTGLLKFDYAGENYEFLSDIAGIKVAQSRLTGLKDDEKVLVKELRQGKILSDNGLSIYILPKMKDQNGENIPGPDAIVNGVLFEFKNITGGIDRVEIRFRQSRKQCENVYLKIDNPGISKDDVISRIRSALRDKKYSGGTNGNLIIYLAQTGETCFMSINDLK